MLSDPHPEDSPPQLKSQGPRLWGNNSYSKAQKASWQERRNYYCLPGESLFLLHPKGSSLLCGPTLRTPTLSHSLAPDSPLGVRLLRKKHEGLFLMRHNESGWTTRSFWSGLLRRCCDMHHWGILLTWRFWPTGLGFCISKSCTLQCHTEGQSLWLKRTVLGQSPRWRGVQHPVDWGRAHWVCKEHSQGTTRAATGSRQSMKGLRPCWGVTG